MLQLDDFRCMNNGEYRALDRGLLHSYGEGFCKRNTKSRKRALLLLHGFTSCPAVYRNFYPKLPAYDYISAPVLAGHGQNRYSFSQSSAEAWLKTGEDALNELVKEFEEVDVLGLSLGGFIAFNIARIHPVRKLFLLAPALSLTGDIRRTQKFVQLCRSLGFTNLRAKAGNLRSSLSAEIAYRQIPLPCIEEIFSSIQCADLTIPSGDIILFLGRHDQVVHSENVAGLFENQPNTKTIWLEQSAHVLPLDLDYERILSELTAQF